ncbi:dromaiocalcin-2-like [Antennarius striatus]|uniref:dromaiocalcin-2-like n=1 Tax=Antennarius striatus TaxID=241820 RepID=UPI0035B06318
MAIIRSAVVLIPLLLLVCILDTGETCAPNEPFYQNGCGDWYRYRRGLCMKYFDQPKYWILAKRHCKDLGGDLLTIHSQTERNCVRNMVTRYSQQYKGPVWIGITLIGTIYGDADGYAAISAFWASKEPISGKSCVAVSYDRFAFFETHNCFDRFPFFCVKKSEN